MATRKAFRHAVDGLIGAFIFLLACVLALGPLPEANAQDWAGSSVDRGYVVEAEPNRQSNPRRHCVPRMFDELERKATLLPPPGGWPGEPQAVAVFNLFSGEVMIAHGADAICGQMHDMRTRDSRFRAGVGQVVVPPKGSTDPIIVAWETPLLAAWVPTIKLGSPLHLQFEDTARLLLRAACMAITLALALSALMGWLAVREKPFLYYASGCMVLFLWQAMISGLSGYPYPWFPFLPKLIHWQVVLSLMSTVLMFIGLIILAYGKWLRRPAQTACWWLVAVSGAVSLLTFFLPLPILRFLAMVPVILTVVGSAFVLTTVLIRLLGGHKDAVPGSIALLPFIAIVVGEMSGATWWISHRVEVHQLAVTWLLMLVAYALNQRLGMIRLQRDEMRRLADTDVLTGLSNRRSGMQRLKMLHADAAEKGGALSIAFVDVDHFKSINDTCGHEGGDQVLVAIARLLSESVRGADDVVRMGGEEFLLLLPSVEAESARERMETIRMRISTQLSGMLASGGKVTVSIGVAQLGKTDRDADMLLRRADTAMYQAKQAGRDRVQLA